MNIGIVTTWFERGASIVSRAYLKALSNKHNVFVYARAGEKYARGDPRWDQDYVTWGKIFPERLVTYVDWKDFQEWTRENGLDAVIFNEQRSWEIILRARHRLSIALGTYIDYYTPTTVPFFWLYDFLLCNTKRHYSVFKSHPNPMYIPWGTDIDVFKPVDSNHSKEKVVFFHSCGVSPLRKGTDILVRAFQHVGDHARLVIHSQSPYVELGGSSLDAIRHDSRIELIERDVAAPGLYHLGDVYVYPSRLEGIGLTIAEALASGLPVITTDSPPMNEFVVHNLNGKLVEVERYQKREDNYYFPESICSEEALAAAMTYFVENASELEGYKDRARSYAEMNLDWSKNAARLAALLEDLPQSRKPLPELELAASNFERSQYLYPHYLESAVLAWRRVRRFKNQLSRLIGEVRS
jgi:1,2-diacylglycerol 3-alpha-glucosyltransferase